MPAELTLENGQKLTGKVEQLSEGGLLFVGRAPVEPTRVAELRFPEPIAGRVVLVRVQCRWSGQSRGKLYQAGFSFETAPAPPVELFRAYVAFTTT